MIKFSSLIIATSILALLILSSVSSLTDKDGNCILLTPAQFGPPSNYNLMTCMKNFTSIPLQTSLNAPILIWEAPSVINLDNVRLQIKNTVTRPVPQDEKMYLLDPITTNHNDANTADKWLYVKMTYASKKSGASKNMFFSLDDLVGCNVDLFNYDHVDYTTIKWSYVVLHI